MNWKRLVALAAILVLSTPIVASAQHSVARQWNEELLAAIRVDFARPTVHARNLFHTSIAMYDAWAAYDQVAEPFFLGKTIDGFTCAFTGIPAPADIQVAREEAISYAAYRLLKHRFSMSPGAAETQTALDNLFATLGYDKFYAGVDYASGNPADLGNYLAQCLIQFGLQDGANELGGGGEAYGNLYYEPVNPTLIPVVPGNPDIIFPNRWQPLTLDVFIDQSGNVIPLNTPNFLSPEWGNVVPFSLTSSDLTIYSRDGDEYWVYHDPGAPPMLDTLATDCLDDPYKWGFTLVSVWQSHNDPMDGVMWDISPRASGNVQSYPTTIADYPLFYDFFDGGDTGTGHPSNPFTGQPYPPNVVPRGDYTRVLAEFWADGPDSETPPGHWFTILNYVNDHPQFEKRFEGTGPILDELEWDVKAYMLMGGAMHDCAVSAWGIKGWYDYLRPISAIRYMADLGQCSDMGQPNFDTGGIPLIPNFVELVGPGDPLADSDSIPGENINKVKLYTWRGPDFIEDPDTTVAGVGWILAENWWPYQRPTFVTPPFAGFVSGHSTYSRAAAVIMTMLTGDPFFPGGVGEFVATKNEFLVFEDGPSVDVVLQWATYQDASDQTSLSRIWGGIHPPADDIPGRVIGETIGVQAWAHAVSYFDGTASPVFINEFAAELTNDGILLSWVVAADEPIVGFRIYRADGADAQAFPINGSLIEPVARRYVDTTAPTGVPCRYTLVAIGEVSGEVRSQTVEATRTPNRMQLAQNHPNPFNPTTTIRFAVPEVAPVTLGVYSASGRLVRTLVSAEQMPSGSHEVTWDGRNNFGESVASGIYLYRLQVDNRVMSKKMTLLK